ncbi:conserved Plasmodium protein, unknown function [Plasmodium relictum]|uniref:Uncharacterized protein n=1 Tax=Plasmodium relictum TaxID=85471 RepID=A0A1J1HDJ8_PLARL|nr:conserved Plasmodium protein, unknown function [Plasmodium relictum]CRH04004.1 conserved Plasmodium protein, unknown function [Plasmodium relictum]
MKIYKICIFLIFKMNIISNTCILMFALTSLITYIYCFLKSYESDKDMRTHKLSQKFK